MNKLSPTAEMIAAAENVFLAMAYTDTIRPVIKANERQAIKEGNYKMTDKHHPIRNGATLTDEKLTYLLSDEDAARFFERCEELNTAAGFKPTKKGNCPLLEGENLLRKAQNLLIDEMQVLTKISYEHAAQSVNCVENIKQLVELSLKLLAPYISSNRILTSLKKTT